MGKPKRVFYLEQTGAKVHYGQKAGGLFATLAGMVGRRDTMINQGASTKTWYADVDWKEYDDVEVE